MLTDAARVVGITGCSLRRGASAEDDFFSIDVALEDGTTAWTWWSVQDLAEECKGQRITAIVSIGFMLDAGRVVLALQVLCDDGSTARITWSRDRMWSYLSRVRHGNDEQPTHMLLQ